jgi:intracellular sulfur oxidation DsrE/DsrF family protein
MKLLKLTLAAALAGLVSMPALGAGQGNTKCPVGLVTGMSLDDEFGPGTSDITKCIKKRHQVKMVVQINQFTDSSGRPYGLVNIGNILDDYEITHGMRAGRDYEIVAVLHSPGGRMALKDVGFKGDGSPVTGRNPYEGTIRGLMARGVKFYFCQNTTRAYLAQPPTSITSLPKYLDHLATGLSATGEMIEGIDYTTAGLTSIADFEAQGYQYIQP